MNTHKSIYGYLNAALHFANPQKSSGSERSLFYPDPLDYVDNSPEEILYKSYWEAYFNDKPSTWGNCTVTYYQVTLLFMVVLHFYKRNI